MEDKVRKWVKLGHNYCFTHLDCIAFLFLSVWSVWSVWSNNCQCLLMYPYIVVGVVEM